MNSFLVGNWTIFFINVVSNCMFQNSKVPICAWLKVIYYFACDAQLYQIEHYVKEVSKKTLIKMMAKLRQICRSEVNILEETLVFGNEVECICNVEIDEACFGKKRKHSKGKTYKKVRVFGITERNSNKVLFKLVQKRDKATLLPIIKKHISTAATIHHDDWPAYRKLSSFGYKHLIVNHSKSFKGSNGACTNTIEGIWGVMKQRISRMHGMEISRLESYLCEYAFRYYHKDNMLSALMSGIASYKL